FREINESKIIYSACKDGELMSDLDNIEREIEGLQRKMYDIQKTLESMDRSLESYLERIARAMERISEKLWNHLIQPFVLCFLFSSFE
ncbi:MAG: hypothetical protein KAS22_12260, partial [Candidatus Heimdallarchaeota archaeon]|nr:hypothetical protein [Candidatus Heimdallarchaeota archaeon]